MKFRLVTRGQPPQGPLSDRQVKKAQRCAHGRDDAPMVRGFVDATRVRLDRQILAPNKRPEMAGIPKDCVVGYQIDTGELATRLAAEQRFRVAPACRGLETLRLGAWSLRHL